MKKIILVFLGLVLGWAVVEIYLQAAALIQANREATIQNINESSKIYRYDSRLGWLLVPDSSGRQKTSEFDVIYRINHQGLRDDRNYSLKRGDKKRIIVLGDSFAFGLGVPNNETYPKALEAQTNYEVFNFGVAGYDPGQYYLLLKYYSLQYNPDVIVYTIYLGNDIEDIVLPKPSQAAKYKPYFRIKDGNLTLFNSPVPQEENQSYPVQALSDASQYNQAQGQVAPTTSATTDSSYTDYRVKNRFVYESLGWLLNLKTALLFKNFLKDNFYPVLSQLGLVKSIDDYDENFLVIRKLLEETKTMVGNKKLIVVIAPSKNIKYNYLERQFGEKLQAILQQENISFINMVPAILQSNNLYFPIDGHWNQAGNRLAAQLLAEELAKENPGYK